MDNIFDAPKYQEVKKEMMKLLKKEIQEYEDFDALNVLFEIKNLKNILNNVKKEWFLLQV